MTADEIRAVIKEAIGKVGKIDPRTVHDRAAFREDLGLDSLSILEIVVEVQSRLGIPDVPDDAYAGIRTIEDAVRLVRTHLFLGVG